MDQREFLEMIQACRRRLNLAGFLKKLVSALCVGAGVGIVFQAVSLVIPLYYANVYTGIALLLAVLTAILVSGLRQCSMEQAALVMDGFGFEERIITAYENLGKEGALFALQRKDAMFWLKNNRGRIQIPLSPDRKKIALMAALLVAMAGLMLAPSSMRDQARDIHQIRQEAREKTEEIEEVLEELEQLEELGQDTLTPEQLEALREMAESLQSSISEYNQASSAEALQAAGEKLDYKYSDMGSQMSALAESIQNGATVSSISAESMQAMAQKLQDMSGNSSSDSDSLASNQKQDGDGQSGQGGNGQNGQGGDSQGGGQKGKDDGQGGGQNGQSGSGQNGQNGNGQNGQNGSGQDGQNSQGRGTGTADNAHDYVSIPNMVADSDNLTGNAIDHDASEYFRAQNGLSWEGTHVSYEEVIGSYEENAYEGIASGRYPSGMEDVIKEYFSSFN